MKRISMWCVAIPFLCAMGTPLYANASKANKHADAVNAAKAVVQGTTPKSKAKAKPKAAPKATPKPKARPKANTKTTPQKDFTIKSTDGFPLSARWMFPAGKTAKTASRVIVLVHGSGPASKNSDLTRVTRGGQKNWLFQDVGRALVKQGFAIIRYDKRTYTINRAYRSKHPKVMTWLKAFRKAPLTALINDAKSVVGFAKKANPKAKVYLLGFSQGTYVSLQAANNNPQVSGVGLVGFYVGSMFLSLAYAQILYRPILMLQKYDTNKNGALEDKELTKAGRLGMALGMQFSLLDINKDKKLSWQEIQGGNMLNLFRMMKRSAGRYVQEEVALPSVVRILRKVKKKVVFFQGMRDNQTPASHAIAIRHANRLQWKNGQLQFHFFPKLGHILDPRKNYHDLQYNRISPKALTKMGKVLNTTFK